LSIVVKKIDSAPPPPAALIPLLLLLPLLPPLLQGKEWFELTPESCELLGFQKPHTRGSLWRLMAEMNTEEEHE